MFQPVLPLHECADHAAVAAESPAEALHSIADSTAAKSTAELLQSVADSIADSAAAGAALTETS
jgi:hypothetical protein